MTGLEHSAHVLEKGGKVFSATLGLVDIVKGTNSYYKLQLLEDDKESRCVLGGGSSRGVSTSPDTLVSQHGGTNRSTENTGVPLMRPSVREGRGRRLRTVLLSFLIHVTKDSSVTKGSGFA